MADVTERDDQISREACRTNSGGDADRGRGWSTRHPVSGAACAPDSTADGNAASASGAAFVDAAAATTEAQQVNAAPESPW